MPGRTTVPLALICLAACASPSTAPAPRVAGPAPPARQEPASTTGAHLFQGLPEASFWVSHAADGDRRINGGVRLELSPAGEVRAAAWELGLSRIGDPLVGALEVPARLGGGFLHWTRSHLFRSREFTGPLERVDLGSEVAVRGARSGLSSILVLTDGGPRELLPGRARLSPLAEPGIFDEAAVSATRALVLDVFGRARETDDGGRSYVDLSPAAGTSARQLLVGEGGDLWIETWQGRVPVAAGGGVGPPTTSGRQTYDSSRALQILWKGSEVDRTDWSWAFQQTSPLAAAVAAGARVGDGTAFGVSQSYVLRVDLATGKVVSTASASIPNGLECQPMRAPDAVLFACLWQPYQGYGGYVLRSTDGGAPEVEKVFTDDGGFVADDRGALGFTGSCRATPRLFDPEEQMRAMESEGERPMPPVLCVRRAPGEWVERRVDAGPGTAIVGWAPRLDGTAVALALSTDPLPPARGSGPRVVDRGDVQLVRLYRETPGWSFKRASLELDRGGLGVLIDRRFSARDDGTIDGWLGPTPEGEGGQLAVGVTLGADGVPAVHDPAPGAALTVASGAYAIAISRDGDLHESTDHGRTWRFAGRSPVPPAAHAAAGCSELGCALGAVVRVGWGDGAVAPRVGTDPPPAPEPPAPTRPPKLTCTSQRGPVPLAAPPPPPPGARQTLTTSWGETIDILRAASAPPSPPLPSPPRGGVGGGVSGAVLRTHTLLMRPPFSPLAAVRRLNATDAGFNPQQRRLPILPLLGPTGEVDLLVVGDPRELLVAGDRVTSMPAFEPRRWMPADGTTSGGLSTADGHALVIGETRRRTTLEDHAPGPSPPPIYLGMDRELARRRAVSLARRDDGGIGLLVLDGPAPETAGVAAIDRMAASPSAVVKLAPWSTLVTADDPRCKADREAYTALVLIDPATWLSLDPAALPGVALGHQGMAKVRWGRERVCIEGLEAAVTDPRRGEPGRSWSLSARWGGERDRGAALRTSDLVEELSCRVGPRP